MKGAVIGSLRTSLVRAYHALAYAHCGEMLTPAGKSRALGSMRKPDEASGRGSIASVITPPSRKRVLLAFNERLDSGALRYATDAADRFDAELDIISNLPECEVSTRISHQLGRMPTGGRIYRSQSDLVNSIADYTLSHRDVLFIVTSDNDAQIDSLTARRPANHANCAPWLVISNQRRAA